MYILLVEDEPDIGTPLLELLRQSNYDVTWAISATEARAALSERDYDLAILDIMLPEGEEAGFDLARELRDANFPGAILFLTARDAIDDRVHGLDVGGDDYLLKPFSLKEFLARVRALLRRAAQTRQATLERGPLRVDFSARTAHWQGRLVEFSEREFAVLELLALYPERVFTVEELLDRFFPDAESGHRVVRVYIHQLRQKTDGALIKTMMGGYKLGLT